MSTQTRECLGAHACVHIKQIQQLLWCAPQFFKLSQTEYLV